MKTVREIQRLEGVKVLVRVDFNVPIIEGKVADDFRVRKVLPMITYLRGRRAKVILMSHIESTSGRSTLAPVARLLESLGIPCGFIKNYRDAYTTIDNMQNGDVVLLENLREHNGEKVNDKAFAKELASLADVYVNEAFSSSHRSHASLCAITSYLPSYAGILFEEEVRRLRTAFSPEHPFLFILCGAKFATKIPLISKFVKIADHVFVGGALANNFFKEQGFSIGKSIVSPSNFDLKNLLATNLDSGGKSKILLPIDVVVSNGDDNNKRFTKQISEVGALDVIDDTGKQTLEMLRTYIKQARYILWNGPLGAYEHGFVEPTLEVARMIAEATSAGATSIVGGGDTLAAIAKLGLQNKYSFVSTGGGAMLEFLATETLPVIEALNGSKV